MPRVQYSKLGTANPLLNLSFIPDRLSKLYIPGGWKGSVPFVDNEPQRDPAFPFSRGRGQGALNRTPSTGTARTRQCYLIEVSLIDVLSHIGELTPEMASINELFPTDWEPMTAI